MSRTSEDKIELILKNINIKTNSSWEKFSNLIQMIHPIFATILITENLQKILKIWPIWHLKQDLKKQTT